MSKLVQLQQDFLKAFNEQNPTTFTKHIHNQTALTAEKRFSIYQGSAIECLANSLRETYEVCEKLVGEDFFNGLAYTYIQQASSYSPDLGDYGQSFAAFIEQFPPAQQLPYLPDICRLCWAYHVAYRTEIEQPFDIESFAQLSEAEQAGVILTLPQSAQCLASPYPIQHIWKFCQLNAAEQSAEPLDLNSGGVKLMVWRNAHEVVIDELNDSEWQLAQLLTERLTLVELQQRCDLKQINLAELLPSFLTKSWLST